MKIITVELLTGIIIRHGFEQFLTDLMAALKRDFKRWDMFTKMPRPAMHVPGGVLELMPICDNELYYSFKYVNCHPKNTHSRQMTVVATGQLSRIDTGYPLMISEMTLLTAMRTAAASALATDLMSRKNSHKLAIIGNGAQSEFQAAGIRLVRDITEIRFFDSDPRAMDKFERNMKGKSVKLIRCRDAGEAVIGADIITVVTACKAHVDVIKNDWINKGVHINALGGDTVGKTELELGILPRSRIMVEYFEQSHIEGEIQRLDLNEARKLVFAEFYELVNGAKKGRNSEDEITLYDSVGIALEDYSVLRLTYELSKKYGMGEELNLIPNQKDPKDLISIIRIGAEKGRKLY